ncbi:MAG: HAMP domain-containing histidine kinase [Chloroflexi bacterium]|nr:MAG: HAMP domain-containing histidine kinase [Chloroflexota bacterium]
MARKVASYAFIGFLASACVAINIAVYPYTRAHPDSVVMVLFIAVMTSAMSIPEVRIDRGTLTLNGVVSGAAAILLNPLDATLVGLATSLPFARRGVWPMLGNAAIYATVVCLSSLVSAHFRSGMGVAFGPRVATLITLTASDVVLVATAISVRTGESGLGVIQRNVTPYFFLAFGYFCLSALLISYVLDGSVLGYILATIVCVLALALTDTIAGRRVRRVLESELSDADRHLFHSRAVEGVVHNLRNHMATALAYLKEIDTRKLESPDRESLETATDAANDAVAVLRALAQGATPKVSYAPNPVDLNVLVTRAVGMARPRARGKEVQFAVHEAPTDVGVKADPLLMREVMTNLLNNAIDAVSHGGRVDISTGRRNNGWPYVSVADNGPGISDDHRHHLFEPHFTTKEGGTGLGLFMSYGIVREHQGQLTYDGGRRGAVFTVSLPPFNP